jgi:hypothetical protein
MPATRRKASAVAAGPEVVRFTATLVRGSGAKAASAVSLEIPKAAGARLRGMSRLEGIINGHPFRAPLEANAAGGYSLRVNQAMLAGAKAKPGDTVRLAVLGPEPDPVVPPDLDGAFGSHPDAAALWDDLTVECRRDYLRRIDATANPATRARRVQRTVEQLAEGKRRPCCVNFYEFMLQRVNE